MSFQTFDRTARASGELLLNNSSALARTGGLRLARPRASAPRLVRYTGFISQSP